MSHFTSSLIMMLKKETGEPNLGANQLAYLLSQRIKLFFICVANLFPPHASLQISHPTNLKNLRYLYQVVARGLNQPNYEALIRIVYQCLFSVVESSYEATYSINKFEIIGRLLTGLKSIGAIEADEAIKNDIVEHLDYIAKKISDNKGQFTVSLISQDTDFSNEKPIEGTGNKSGTSCEPPLIPPQGTIKPRRSPQQKEERIELQGIFKTQHSSKGVELIFKVFGSDEEFKVDPTHEFVKNISERHRKTTGKPPIAKIGMTNDKKGRVKLYDMY